MSKFKVGDKVEFSVFDQKGIGKVVAHHKTKGNLLVHSKEIKRGHDGNIDEFKQDNYYNWWFEKSSLTLIEKAEKPKEVKLTNCEQAKKEYEEAYEYYLKLRKEYQSINERIEKAYREYVEAERAYESVPKYNGWHSIGGSRDE